MKLRVEEVDFSLHLIKDVVMLKLKLNCVYYSNSISDLLSRKMSVLLCSSYTKGNCF